MNIVVKKSNCYMCTRNAPIGFMDSGIGGLTVLKSAVTALPGESFVYYGDNDNAPYGIKQRDEIRLLCRNACEKLLSYGVKAIVIACNTATSAAVDCLRHEIDIPIIGMEPALKPAAQKVNGGKVLVMATTATLRQEKFKNLYDKYAHDNCLLMPCDGLVKLVEAKHFDDMYVTEYIKQIKKDINGEKIDAVVLGCTHFIFAKKVIENEIGLTIDGNSGTIAHLNHVLNERGLLSTNAQANVRLLEVTQKELFISALNHLELIAEFC